MTKATEISLIFIIENLTFVGNFVIDLWSKNKINKTMFNICFTPLIQPFYESLPLQIKANLCLHQKLFKKLLFGNL